MAGIATAAKLAGPVADRPITDIEPCGDGLHGLLFDEHRAQRFVAALRDITGLQEVVSVIASVHGRLLAKLSSN